MAAQPQCVAAERRAAQSDAAPLLNPALDGKVEIGVGGSNGANSRQEGSVDA
jgi:hypothetical protein